tara:strand:- start:164 stop:439 length:276 start_codon:yes stop_codon:yes gene_type:complete
MSAPQTDIEKQERRHWGPLAGIALGILVVAALFIGWMVWITANGQEPREATPEGGVIGNEQPLDQAQDLNPVEPRAPEALVPSDTAGQIPN